MGEALQRIVEAAPWAPAAAAFLFGLAAGWLIWGGRRDTIDNTDRIEPEPTAARAGPDPESLNATIGAVENEIRAARTLLSESDQEAAEFATEIAGIDDRLKKANARMKLIMSAVRKAPLRD